MVTQLHFFQRSVMRNYTQKSKVGETYGEWLMAKLNSGKLMLVARCRLWQVVILLHQLGLPLRECWRKKQWRIIKCLLNSCLKISNS